MACDIDESVTHYILTENGNLWETETPMGWDLSYLPEGYHDFSLAPANEWGEGPTLGLIVYKTGNSRFDFYKLIFEKADKIYFDKDHISLKVKK